MSDLLAQPIVVDNRPGASGKIGTDIVARSVPDGHTIMMGTISTLVLSPLMSQSSASDPSRELDPLGIIGTTAFLLLTNTSMPVKSVNDLIALAKSQPGKLNFASASSGTTGHLALELFKIMARVDVTHIPFKGGGPAMTALIGGEVQLLFDSITTSIPQVRAGRVRALAISSSQRSALVPDIPTLDEAGVRGFDPTGWWALAAPRKVHPQILERLRRSVLDATRSDDIRERLGALGAEPFLRPPAEHLRFIQVEHEKWARVIRSANIRAE